MYLLIAALEVEGILFEDVKISFIIKIRDPLINAWHLNKIKLLKCIFYLSTVASL